MVFQIDSEKKAEFSRSTMGLSSEGIAKRHRILMAGCWIFLIIGLISAFRRGIWARSIGGDVTMILINAMLGFVIWGAFSMMVCILARLAKIRSAGIIRQESVEIQGDILIYSRRLEGERTGEVTRIDLLKTTVCEDKTFHSLMFTDGVVEENSTLSRSPVEKLCDLEIVDYFLPSLTVTLRSRGIRINDWDDPDDPACQRPEQFSHRLP